MKVTKAVIPAAGFGTRVLPAVKAIPKEMLPIVDKPSIQYIVEEAANSGITDILIITSRGKSALEDHFDLSPELESKLRASGRDKDADSLRSITSLARIHFVRQPEAKGLGHAIMFARSFAGGEPFVVLYGDDVILGEKPVTLQLIEAYELYGRAACGIKQVPPEDLVKYSSLKVEHIAGNAYNVTDMVEKKPVGEAFSLFSILGRVLLTPDIFPILKRTAPGAGGEIQLTDAMAELARGSGMTGVDFVGQRYDMGNKLGILKANIDVGLVHPETGNGLREYLRSLDI